MFYNRGMDRDELQAKAYDLIDAFEKSDLLEEIRALSRAIAKDGTVRLLSKERNDLYLRAASKDGKEREDLLAKAKEKDDRIHALPLVQRYDERYRALRSLVRHLEEGLREVLS